MAFTEQQVRILKARLHPKHVHLRKSNGVELRYIEGWHAIAEANRVFGHDGWDRNTLQSDCLYYEKRGDWYHAAYRVRVCITVRAGETLITREGTGTGEAKALTQGQAHEVALKGGETDATKRALATFGNPFGLSLYEHCGNRASKHSPRKAEARSGPWRLVLSDGTSRDFSQGEDFAKALNQVMLEARDIETLFNLWEANVETVRALNRALKEENEKDATAQNLVAHLKACAIAIAASVKGTATEAPASDAPHQKRAPTDASNELVSLVNEQPSGIGLGPRIDKSRLRFGELKRIRSKEHLRFVARQPCLICGRTPSQAHHIRYAQPRGISLKVSDEFAVPLCAIHHMENHACGNERKWWEEHNLNPLSAAEHLWKKSRQAANP